MGEPPRFEDSEQLSLALDEIRDISASLQEKKEKLCERESRLEALTTLLQARQGAVDERERQLREKEAGLRNDSEAAKLQLQEACERMAQRSIESITMAYNARLGELEALAESYASGVRKAKRQRQEAGDRLKHLEEENLALSRDAGAMRVEMAAQHSRSSQQAMDLHREVERWRKKVQVIQWQHERAESEAASSSSKGRRRVKAKTKGNRDCDPAGSARSWSAEAGFDEPLESLRASLASLEAPSTRQQLDSTCSSTSQAHPFTASHLHLIHTLISLLGSVAEKRTEGKGLLQARVSALSYPEARSLIRPLTEIVAAGGTGQHTKHQVAVLELLTASLLHLDRGGERSAPAVLYGGGGLKSKCLEARVLAALSLVCMRGDSPSTAAALTTLTHDTQSPTGKAIFLRNGGVQLVAPVLLSKLGNHAGLAVKVLLTVAQSCSSTSDTREALASICTDPSFCQLCETAIDRHPSSLPADAGSSKSQATESLEVLTLLLERAMSTGAMKGGLPPGLEKALKVLQHN